MADLSAHADRQSSIATDLSATGQRPTSYSVNQSGTI